MSEPTEHLSELDDTTEAYVGAVLLFEPYYGNGWQYGVDQPAPGVPMPFRARLLRLWSDAAGLRQGGIAHIKEVGHPFDECFVTFETYMVGCYNFTDRLCRYSAAITDSEPGGAVHGWPLGPRDPDIRMSGWVIVAAPSASRGRPLARFFDH